MAGPYSGLRRHRVRCWTVNQKPIPALMGCLSALARLGKPPCGLRVKHYGCLDGDRTPHNSHAGALLFEQGQAGRPPWLALSPKTVFLCCPLDAFSYGCDGALLHLSLGDQELLLHTPSPQAKEFLQLLQACTANKKL